MDDATHVDWETVKQHLTIPTQAYIHGQFVNAVSGETHANINPADGSVITQVAKCGAKDADVAIRIARQVFEDGIWSQMAPKERKLILVRWANLIEKHKQELAYLESIDAGKPISDTFLIDVPSAINTIRWTGEAIDKVYNQIAPTDADTLALVERVPLGVVLAIVPWNFPLSTTAWKLAPALATGNSVILKPDPKTPLTALRIAQLASEAGLPDGVLNVLPGDGEHLGKYLAMSMNIDGQTFTGSTRVGKLLQQYSGRSNLKRTFLELGGKSANIVFADADLDTAAQMAAAAGFYNSGQTCTAGSRLLIEETIYDEFLQKVKAKAEEWKSGHPISSGCAMGAIINQEQLNSIQRYVEQGIQEGAQLICGGNVVHPTSGGFYHEATIFSNVTNNMTIAREEIFGPVICAIKFQDPEQAIAIANDSPYGLAGAVWSNNINTALKVAKGVRTGTMGVNNYFGGDMTVPFGGFKESGNGRDKSIHAMYDYTELKTTWIELA